jgi:phage virion morphogenesis protein
MISIEYNDPEVIEALGRLAALLDDMSPAMHKIGGYMRDQTEDRFKTETDPLGNPWAPRSAVTLRAYEQRAKKPGEQASWGGVLHYSGQLSGNIFSESGPDWARIGSPEPYAAMMQFGGTKSAFPHLWGDIPARPYLGVSEEDHSGILDIIAEQIGNAMGVDL